MQFLNDTDKDFAEMLVMSTGEDLEGRLRKAFRERNFTSVEDVLNYTDIGSRKRSKILRFLILEYPILNITAKIIFQFLSPAEHQILFLDSCDRNRGGHFLPSYWFI